KTKSPMAPATTLSTACDTLGVHIYRIDRLAGGHEHPVALTPAKTEIGTALGQCDVADHPRVRGEDRDPVEPRGHPPAAPQIAFDIAAEPVGGAVAGIDKDPAIGKPGAVADDVEDANEPRPRTRFDDIKLGLIG